MEYQDYLKKMAKKEAKKAKKKAKKADMKLATEKLAQLSAVAQQAQQEFVGPPTPPEPEIKSFTATGQPSRYTEKERAAFQSRIDNEKKNIWRMCSADAEQILKFCEANKADERNAAVRYAREAAVKWASTQVKVPF